MFKALGNLLYKTPWWALALAGFFAFLVLALFAVPFNVIRLTDSGKTTTENRAIQREIDRTFGEGALTIAERVVRSLSEHTTDPARKAEFAQALKEIAGARAGLSGTEAESSAKRAQADSAAARGARRAAKNAEREARQLAREVTQHARDAARATAAAVRSRDDAREKIKKLRDARETAVNAQKRVGLNDASAFTVFDDAIAAAGEAEKEANETLKKLTEEALDGGVDSKKPADVIGDSEKSSLQINGVEVGAPAAPAPPAPPLPPALRDDIRRQVSADFRRLGIGSALIVAIIPIFIILLIAKVYIGRSRRALEVAGIKTREAESANVNRQIVEAKLMALQAQVEPHFLYNTLANVQALTEVDPVQANKMTGHLIQYLRASLPKMRENISTVGQEIELVRAYLNILKMRMGSRLEFDISMPADLEALPFPPLMLPSLVENAIKHGLEPQRDGGRIDVIAEKIGTGEKARLRIMVKDTGRGLADAPLQSGGGIGLTNIRERLLALFGDQARLTLESNTPAGVIATIETPAAGARAFVSAAAAAPATAATATTWGAKTLHAAARTHSAWAGILIKAFVGIIAVLGVLFVVGLIGLATNAIPLTIFDTKLSGLEGMAIGTLAFLLVFGILSIVALILTAIIYGLGFLFVGLALSIPVLILVSLFPVLAPFVVIGFAIYWFWWRKRRVLGNSQS